eukprot:3677894-Alexandrium_andersonii.AAC.1
MKCCARLSRDSWSRLGKNGTQGADAALREEVLGQVDVVLIEAVRDPAPSETSDPLELGGHAR